MSSWIIFSSMHVSHGFDWCGHRLSWGSTSSHIHAEFSVCGVSVDLAPAAGSVYFFLENAPNMWEACILLLLLLILLNISKVSFFSSFCFPCRGNNSFLVFFTCGLSDRLLLRWQKLIQGPLRSVCRVMCAGGRQRARQIRHFSIRAVLWRRILMLVRVPMAHAGKRTGTNTHTGACVVLLASYFCQSQPSHTCADYISPHFLPFFYLPTISVTPIVLCLKHPTVCVWNCFKGGE